MSRRALLLLGCWLAFTLVTGLLYALVPPCADHSSFDYIGWIALTGGRLYVDVVEQNWPGAMWVHTASTWLFGNHLWSFRLLDYCIMLGGAAALAGLASMGGRPATRWIVVPLYQAMYTTLNPWVAGQRDMIAAHVLLGLGLAYEKRRRGGSRAWLVAFGLGMVFVAVTRPTYLVFPLLLLVAELLLRGDPQRRPIDALADMLTAGAFCVGGLALLALYALNTGALQGWYDCGVLFNTQLYSGSASYADVTRAILDLRFSYHWYFAFAALGIVSWWRRGERRALAVAAVVACTGLVSIYAQRKAFGYHAAAWIPVLALFAAEFLAWMIEAARERRTFLARAAAAVACGIAILGIAKKVHGTLGPELEYVTGRVDRQGYLARIETGFGGLNAADLVLAADYAREHTSAEDTVLVWHRGIAINFLAARRSPVPFATIGMLESARAPFVRAGAWLKRFEETLRTAPPRLVFVESGSTADPSVRAPRVGGEPSSRAVDALVASLRDRYQRVAQFGRTEVYRLAP